MDLKLYLGVLWRRKLVLFFTILATTSMVVVNTRMQTPMYRASAILRVASSAGGSLNYSDYVYVTQLMNTYVQIATSRPILDELSAQMDLKELPAITAEIIPNTELVKITVESSNPAIVAKTANVLAEILITDSKEMYSGGGKTSQEILGEQLIKAQAEFDQAREEYAKLIIQTPPATGQIETARQLVQLNQSTYTTLLGQFTQAALREEIRANMITVVEPAVVPEDPFEPRVSLNYALGFLVGLVGGLGLVLVFESLDTCLYKSEDIESVVELPATAKIPKVNRKQINNCQNDFPPLADAFQNLALNLQPSGGETPGRVLLVMSAEPNQGKSMIVHRLTLSLAELGKKVVAIDCDMRMPKLHTLFDVPNTCGLADVLEKKAGLENALQGDASENFKLLSSGTFSSHPPKLLGSPQMVNLLDSFRRKFDYVLLDTPAFLAAADITAVVPNVDGVLLVARREHARREALQSIKKTLAGFRFRDKSVELVINQAENNYYQYRNKINAKVIPSEL